MCRPTRCQTCGRTTWAGCGQHVAQVKARVPAADWCAGDHSKADQDAVPSALPTGRGWRRLLGR